MGKQSMGAGGAPGGYTLRKDADGFTLKASVSRGRRIGEVKTGGVKKITEKGGPTFFLKAMGLENDIFKGQVLEIMKNQLERRNMGPSCQASGYSVTCTSRETVPREPEAVEIINDVSEEASGGVKEEEPEEVDVDIEIDEEVEPEETPLSIKRFREKER